MAEILNHVLELVEDHVELAHLEYRYERDQSWRRLAVGAITAVCVLGSCLFFQIALLLGLMKAGIPLYVLCLFFGVVYAGASALIYRRFGKRDPRLGESFQGTREEFTRSLQWIHRLFS